MSLLLGEHDPQVGEKSDAEGFARLVGASVQVDGSGTATGEPPITGVVRDRQQWLPQFLSSV